MDLVTWTCAKCCSANSMRHEICSRCKALSLTDSAATIANICAERIAESKAPPQCETCWRYLTPNEVVCDHCGCFAPNQPQSFTQKLARLELLNPRDGRVELKVPPVLICFVSFRSAFVLNIAFSLRTWSNQKAINATTPCVSSL